MPSLPDPSDALIGRELMGKYRVLEKLGAGGFGAVYSALNLDLGTEVAIKISSRPDSDARALREARAAARLRSPHSVRVFDVGRVDGALFIVMELLPGRSLGQYLREQGPLPVELAAKWLTQVCGALHEAHTLDLVHRDLKPSNLFVVEATGIEPHLKLLDFGLAKSLDSAPASDRTASGQVLGSPAYMSPEQVRGTDVTQLSDVWGLGVVLYECLSGRLPFERENTSAVLVAIASEPPSPLDTVARNLPLEVLQLVERCLRKTPRERFASAQELGEALSGLLARSEQAADLTAPLPTFRERPSSYPESASTQQSLTVTKEPAPSRYLKLAPYGVVAALIAISLWLAAERATAPEPERAPSAVSVPEPTPEREATPHSENARAKPETPLPPTPPMKAPAPPTRVNTIDSAKTGAKARPATAPRAESALPRTAPSAAASSRLVLDPVF